MNKALFTIEQAMVYSGLGKTSIYDALARGKLRGRKFGRRTLVEAKSLRAFVAALPAASFKVRHQPNEDWEASGSAT
jgi:excisionase family DNA binding protein